MAFNHFSIHFSSPFHPFLVLILPCVPLCISPYSEVDVADPLSCSALALEFILDPSRILAVFRCLRLCLKLVFVSISVEILASSARADIDASAPLVAIIIIIIIFIIVISVIITV